MSGRWCLVSDDDGHIWLCPAERRQEAMDAINACRAYYDTGDYLADEPVRLQDLEYLRFIDDSHGITFTDPQEMT